MSWQDTVNAGSTNQMPLAVKVTLMVLPRAEDVADAMGQRPPGVTLEEMYPQARVFTTVVNLPTAAAPQGTRILE
jgi:hypothetical protein